jgi:hypothetical protein
LRIKIPEHRISYFLFLYTGSGCALQKPALMLFNILDSVEREKAAIFPEPASDSSLAFKTFSVQSGAVLKHFIPFTIVLGIAAVFLCPAVSYVNYNGST